MKWYFTALKKYAVFSGRACRKEYWVFVLLNILFTLLLWAVEISVGTGGLLAGVYELFILIPSIAVGVRRLHDTGRSGWWIFIILVPILGIFVLLFFFLQRGDEGPNVHGPEPIAQAL